MVLLSENDAQHSLEANFGGQKYLFISNEDIVTTATTIELSKCSKNEMTFWSFPKLKNALRNEAALEPVKTNFFTEYQVSTPAKTIEPVIETISDFKSLIRLPKNAFVECSPKAEPEVMRGSGAERRWNSHEKEKTYTGRNHQKAA